MDEYAQELRNNALDDYGLIFDITGSGSEQIFKKTYGSSKNFVTPNVAGYGVISPAAGIVYEVSYGNEFFDKLTIGVTVCSQHEKRFDLSKSFQSFKEAMEYITSLIKGTY